MSVEKIGAIDQAATDAITMRPVNGGGPAQGRTPAPFPPPPAALSPGAPNPYDSLVLPLPQIAAAEVPSARISASYRLEAARELIDPLIDGRLPEALIRREAETLLRHMMVTGAIGQTEETPPERLPSRNGEDARFDARSRLAAVRTAGRNSSIFI
jgi:hypothetical protein